jgi:hypothetical protein
MEAYYRRLTGHDVSSQEGQAIAMSISVFGALRDPATPHHLALDIFNYWTTHVRGEAMFEGVSALVDTPDVIANHEATLLGLMAILETSGARAKSAWTRLYNLLSACPRFEATAKAKAAAKSDTETSK